MTSAYHALESYYLGRAAWSRGRNLIAAVTLAGWVACAAGLAAEPARFFASYLVAFSFFFTLAAGAMFFVMLQHLTGSAWSVTMRRMAENAAATLPVLGVLFVPVAFGLHDLYTWDHADIVARDPVLQGKQAWLNPQFFVLRAAIYFGIWTLLALRLRAISVAQDAERSLYRTQSAQRWSAPGMVVTFLTVCLASFDWLMSLVPRWYSTMFGVYVYSGGALAFTAALILVLLSFRRHGVLSDAVNEEHYHDLGKWLFALTVFWAYIAFCQYLLIWYANIPEETFWYRDRLTGGWTAVAAVILIGQFFVPFFLLISRGAKRKLVLLAGAAIWMLAVHYVELYWIVMPVFSKSGPQPHWLDAAALLAIGGTLAMTFWTMLRRAALAPVGDIRFEKALEFTNA